MASKLLGLKGLFHLKSYKRSDSTESIEVNGSEELGDADSEGNMTESEDTSVRENSEQPFSVARRLCFVGSLVLCVFTVFVFVFLLPCHEPGCHKTESCPSETASADWSVKFTGIMPSLVHLLDVTGDGHLDVLVEATRVGAAAHLMELCGDFPCLAGVVALKGDFGGSLWALGRNATLDHLTCGNSDEYKFKNSCLLRESSSSLLKINPQLGEAIWFSLVEHTIHAYEFVKDVDGDGVKDIVVLYDPTEKHLVKSLIGRGNINIISGRTGDTLGKPVPIPNNHNSSSILTVHGSSRQTQFILIGSVSHDGNSASLSAISTADLVTRIHQNKDDKGSGTNWGPYSPDSQTGFITLFDGVFALVKPLIVDINSDGVTDLIMCIKDPGLILLALDGKNLQTLWNMSIPSADIHRLIPVGSSKQGKQTNIAVMTEFANHTAALLVVNGLSGNVTWSFHSSKAFLAVPVSVPDSQAFLVWLPWSEAKRNRRESFDQKGIQFMERNDRVHSIREQRKSHKNALPHLVPKEAQKTSDNSYAIIQRRSPRLSEDLSRNPLVLDSDQGVEPIGRTSIHPEHYLEDSYKVWENQGLQSGSILEKASHDVVNGHISSVQHKKTQQSRLTPFGQNSPRESWTFPQVHDTLPLSEPTRARDDEIILGDDIIKKSMSRSRHHVVRRESNHHESTSTVSLLQHNPTLGGGTKRRSSSPAVPRSFPLETENPPTTSRVDTPCGSESEIELHTLSAFLLSQDSDGSIKMDEVTSERPIYLDPKEYEDLFGQKPSQQTCIKLVPRTVVEPVVGDIDDNEEPDLVYAINFVTDESAGSHYMTKIRKLNIYQAVSRNSDKKKKGF